jgi:inhibitor of cysteine peptidase
MKKTILITGLMIALMLGLTACNSGRIKIDKASNGQTIEMKVGQKLVLSLESNPTTGYNWEIIAIDEAILKPSGEAEYESDSKLIGSGGILTYNFEAVQMGSSTVKLIYHRSWEKDVAPLQEFNITVVVK